MTQHVAYYRVSTARQGLSGLGLEAQQAGVLAFLGEASPLAEFIEVESGRKSDQDRPQLAAALAACRKQKATLIVAKLDRLARDVQLILALVDSGVRVQLVDFPEIPTGATGRFLLTMLAAVAEFERRLISERTKAALSAAKARGCVLGRAGPYNLRRNVEQRQEVASQFAARLRPVLAGFDADGLSQREQTLRLNDLGIEAPRGGRWSRTQLARIRVRLRSDML
jgi:DNA invertase Pin-like site-specific DNA recombinase